MCFNLVYQSETKVFERTWSSMRMNMMCGGFFFSSRGRSVSFCCLLRPAVERWADRTSRLSSRRAVRAAVGIATAQLLQEEARKQESLKSFTQARRPCRTDCASQKPHLKQMCQVGWSCDLQHIQLVEGEMKLHSTEHLEEAMRMLLWRRSTLIPLTLTGVS